jgi:hypothetical protein
MAAEAPSAAHAKELRQLLLDQLRGGPTVCWPGADGLTLDEVLSSYPEAAAAGRVPGPDELLAGHPELAAELADFFASRGRPSV